VIILLYLAMEVAGWYW